MEKNLSVKSAKYLDGYRLEITFSNSASRVCDFTEFLKESSHPDVQKYLDIKLFKKFRIEHGDLMWGDFDLVFPIEDLYENHILKKQPRRRSSQRNTDHKPGQTSRI